MNFDNFFEAATGNEPYDYQRRLACGESNGGEDWLSCGAECESRLINIPTDLGKTAAVVLAWLWNRVAPQIENRKSEIVNSQWPRRLVYCLPMRTLVEQTESAVKKWLGNLCAKADELGLNDEAKKQLEWLMKNSPVILMGGEEKDSAKAQWDIYPEQPAILIGTQDILLSRHSIAGTA